VDPYGTVILSKFPPSKVIKFPLPSHQGRFLLWIEVPIKLHYDKDKKIKIKTKNLIISTVHLESIFSQRDVRLEQIEVIFPLLKERAQKIDGEAFVMGDFNFDASPSWEENKCLDNHKFVEVWERIHENKKNNDKKKKKLVILKIQKRI